jgi:hypothetical protein
MTMTPPFIRNQIASKRARIARKSVGGMSPFLQMRFNQANKKKAPTLIWKDQAEDLPEGWIQEIYKRESGASKGCKDKHWISPEERIKFRSWVQVTKFLSALKTTRGNEEEANKLRKKTIKPRKKINHHHNV